MMAAERYSQQLPRKPVYKSGRFAGKVACHFLRLSWGRLVRDYAKGMRIVD
jgi:hypothetical protein